AQAPAALPDLARHPLVIEHVREAFAEWNAEKGGSSMRIPRVLLLDDAPSIDAGEITDKGYINQRLALARRSASVERLFAEKPDPDVIVVETCAGVIPGRAYGANPEPMNTELRNAGRIVVMDPGFPRFRSGPGTTYERGTPVSRSASQDQPWPAVSLAQARAMLTAPG